MKKMTFVLTEIYFILNFGAISFAKVKNIMKKD